MTDDGRLINRDGSPYRPPSAQPLIGPGPADNYILGRLAKGLVNSAWSGATYPGDVLQGKDQVGNVGRNLDMAGLVTGAAGVAPAEEGSLNMGLRGTPKTLSRDVVGEPGYAYHVTNSERLGEIADSGKLNTYRPGDFTDQNVWPDGSSQKRAYFASRPLSQFAPEYGDPVVLRTALNKYIKRESTGDLYSTKPIPTSKLEYLDKSGSWLSVLSDKSD
jgi:hypothetical protein